MAGDITNVLGVLVSIVKGGTPLLVPARQPIPQPSHLLGFPLRVLLSLILGDLLKRETAAASPTVIVHESASSYLTGTYPIQVSLPSTWIVHVKVSQLNHPRHPRKPNVHCPTSTLLQSTTHSQFYSHYLCPTGQVKDSRTQTTMGQRHF
jgi:hypothetical protein